MKGFIAFMMGLVIAIVACGTNKSALGVDKDFRYTPTCTHLNCQHLSHNRHTVLDRSCPNNWLYSVLRTIPLYRPRFNRKH